MSRDDLAASLARAGRRAGFHLLQAVIEGVKALEAVLDEMGRIGENAEEQGPMSERIEIE